MLELRLDTTLDSLTDAVVTTSHMISMLQVLGAAVVLGIVTFFLQSVGKWTINVPWPVRTYTRILVLLVFVWILFHLAGYTLGESDTNRLAMFSNSLEIVGDLIKTLIGAVIGALSATGLFTKGEQANDPEENGEGE